MTEQRRTLVWVACAAILVAVTVATAPRVTTPDAYAGRGQLFFPNFTSADTASSLELTEFDAATASVRPFKVQNRNGLWTIPSHHDYPADARNRLASIATALMGLTRTDVAGDTVSDHETFGVVDPLDDAAALSTGRGTRVVMRGAREEPLADIIIGKPVANRPGFRYVRQPGQRQVYVSQVGDLVLSTSVNDWINPDLLGLMPDDVNAINLRNYALDRSTGRVEPGETVLLQKNLDTGSWEMAGLRAGERLNQSAVDALLRSLSGLRIVNVLPKPPGISESLLHPVGTAALTADDVTDLRRKGFYLTPNGQLISDRGELVVRTLAGVYYTLRFGDLSLDTQSSPAAPSANAPAQGTAPTARVTENRYLFIMAEHVPGQAISQREAGRGEQLVDVLRSRFAPWYYVISTESFEALRLGRRAFVSGRG